MWTVVADVGAGTSANIDPLEPNAGYRVQVRAVGDEAGPWSVSAAGRTGRAGPLTAEFRNVPAEHDGSRPFSCEVVFSEQFHGLELAAFAEGALRIGNGSLVDAKPAAAGENRMVAVRVRPSGAEATTVTLEATTDC